VGPRPDFGFPGYWLYCGETPVVHVAAIATSTEPERTGRLDHVSFFATGLEATRTNLQKTGIHFEEAPVPGWPLHQIFVVDPIGVKVEMTFDLREERKRS